MPSSSVLRLVNCVLGLSALCLFILPGSAAGDPTDVLSFNFTGSVACSSFSPNPCSPNTGIVTGTFSVDSDTEAVVGPWTFSTPFGTISSSGPLAAAFIADFQPSGVTPEDILHFFNTSNGVLTTVQIRFVENAIPGEGSFIPFVTLPGLGIGTSNTCQGTSAGCSVIYDFTSGAASSTPEPSSLLLLGTGLLGLGPFFRRRFVGS